MDLPKFIGENSAKSNPIVNLASYATQDYVLQDQIGLPSASTQLENGFPQTFKMNALMNEIENIEVQSNASFSVPSSSMNMPAANCPNEYQLRVQSNPRTHQEAIRSEMNAIPHHQSDSFQPFCSQFGIPTQQQLPYPVQTHYCYQETPESRKKIVKLLAQLTESQRELEDLENKKKSEETKKKKKVFYFDGLEEEEVFHKPAPDVEWSEGENFYLFLTNNKRKAINIDLQIDEKFEFTKNNPYITIDDPLSQGMQSCREGNFHRAILYYEAAVQKDKHCVIGWQQLIFCLRNDGRHHEAFYLIKNNLHLDQNYFAKVMYSIYISEQYYYQGCQVILLWLKHHPDYYNIVPPDFTLKDQISNIIEKEQLKTLQKILIKASQRSRFMLDYYVQSALSILCEISRDYTKANDCRLYLLQYDSELWKACELVVGINFLRNNEPHKAISYFNKLKESQHTPLFRSHYEHGLGLTYMFLKNYKDAGKCLLTGLHISKMANNILWLRLLLCTQLMKRDDLINLVNNRDFHQLCQEFDCVSKNTTSNVLRQIRKRSCQSPSSTTEKRMKN